MVTMDIAQSALTKWRPHQLNRLYGASSSLGKLVSSQLEHTIPRTEMVGNEVAFFV